MSVGVRETGHDEGWEKGETCLLKFLGLGSQQVEGILVLFVKVLGIFGNFGCHVC